jgi:hypothetical protein
VRARARSLFFSCTSALAPRGLPPLSAGRWKMRVVDARSSIEIVDDTLLDAVLASSYITSCF